MRYLFLIASALWLVARATAHHARQRGNRVRRYAARPLAPRPSVVTGPIPLITPLMASGVEAPPLPPRPVLPWQAPAPAPVDVLRADRTRLGVAVLLDISQPRPVRSPGRHRAEVAA
ncbi:hypothetical protein [Nocardiopsis synnemataformans]|uniref:hypothetical protein n=1 Tax=Nocardiopsis synnemataformans TaxID=61305 RepID=UPI003EBAFED4